MQIGHNDVESSSRADALLNAQVEADDLVVTLEGIVEKFGEEIAPYAVGLCQHLTDAFWHTLKVRIKCETHQLQKLQAGAGP